MQFEGFALFRAPTFALPYVQIDICDNRLTNLLVELDLTQLYGKFEGNPWSNITLATFRAMGGDVVHEGDSFGVRQKGIFYLRPSGAAIISR